MKKYARIIALLLALATCACLLASCGGFKGDFLVEKKYIGEIENEEGEKESGEFVETVTLSFLDGDVTCEYNRTKDGEPHKNVVYKGKYTISGDEIKFNFENVEKGEYVVDFINPREQDLLLDETPVEFKKGEGYVQIAGIKINQKITGEANK